VALDGGENEVGFVYFLMVPVFQWRTRPRHWTLMTPRKRRISGRPSPMVLVQMVSFQAPLEAAAIRRKSMKRVVPRPSMRDVKIQDQFPCIGCFLPSFVGVMVA